MIITWRKSRGRTKIIVLNLYTRNVFLEFEKFLNFVQRCICTGLDKLYFHGEYDIKQDWIF